MEYYNDILCITHGELTDGKISKEDFDALPDVEKNRWEWYVISKCNYDNMCRRGKLKVLRRGCFDTPALIEWDSMPTRVKELATLKYGDPKKVAKHGTIDSFYVKDVRAEEFFANYRLADGRYLPAEKQREYTANAGMLKAVAAMVRDKTPFIKSLGGSTRRVWPEVAEVVHGCRDKHGHKLPKCHRRLKDTVDEWAAAKHDYNYLVEGYWLNTSASKVKDLEQQALLRELLRKHTNIDNEQVAMLYNTVCKRCGWQTIDAVTVGNYRKKWKLDTYGGQHGETSFDNNVAMLVKRKAPSLPMVYWTMDGWDVELLYQKTDTDKNGHSRTTYHNRLTVVIVLDPCGKYPIGYAIDTHETPDLIRRAIRNAVTHTAELFGNRHRVMQLQTDNYGKGALTPFYEACAMKYTPAKAHNAKAKVIETYFKELNKRYCQLMNNWSGFGITTDKSKQPNAEYLNKIKASFPDEEGCRKQIMHIIECEREMKRADYVEAWKELPAADRLAISEAEYLYLLGETTGYTNRLTNMGIVATVGGVKREYDSFDIGLRTHSHLDWALKFDPERPEKVLAVNATSENGKLKEIVGTVRYELTEKYTQPMALYDRTEEDSTELVAIRQFNDVMKQQIVGRIVEDTKAVEALFESRPELNDTLTKLVLVDSRGQHKDNKSDNRLGKGLKAAEKLVKRKEKAELMAAERTFKQERDEYLNGKMDYNDYL